MKIVAEPRNLLLALALLGLTGCALFEVPTIEDIHRKGVATARREVTSPDPARRAAAVEDLGDERSAEVVPLLRTALQDPEPRVRAAAARALKTVGTEGQVAETELLGALRTEKDPEAAVAMGWTLTRWKTDLGPGVASLKAVLNQPDPNWRYQAAMLLEPYVDVLVVAPVYLDTVGTWAEKNANTKPEQCLADLIATDGSKLVGLLEAGVSRTNAAQRAAVARLFSTYRPLPPPGETVLLRLFTDRAAPVRAAAAHAALMSEPQPVTFGPGLLKLLGDLDPEVRANAAWAIGPLVARKVAPAGALETLARGMLDDDAKVREYTALSLGHVGDLPDPVARRIFERLDPAVETSVAVRATAAAALDRAPVTPDLKAALKKGLFDPEAQVRERTLATVGHLQLRDPEFLVIVLERTGATQPKGQRLSAIGALNDLSWKRDDVVAALDALSRDVDADVREAAAFAMKQVEAGTP